MGDLPFVERNVRRGRVYGGRLLRSVAARPLRHNCCFYHVPKSGGTSLSHALHAVVPIHRHIGEVHAGATRRAAAILHAERDDERAFYDDGPKAAEVFALREAQMIAFMANDAALVHGHMIFSAKADAHFGERYKYITMLRDPQSRLLSNYAAAKRAGFVDQPFGAYLKTLIGRAHATHNLRYFSGRPQVAEADIPAALAAAKATIDKFSVIGFVDDLGDFVTRFETVFGARLSIGRYNVAKAEKPELSADDRRRLAELCAPDLELHDYARAAAMRRTEAPAASG